MLLSGMCLMGVFWYKEGVWKVTYGYVLVHRVQSVTNFLNAQTLWTYHFATRFFLGQIFWSQCFSVTKPFRTHIHWTKQF